MIPETTQATIYHTRNGATAVVLTGQMPAAGFTFFGWLLVRESYRQPEMWQRNGEWTEDGSEHPHDLVLKPIGYAQLRDLPPVSIG